MKLAFYLIAAAMIAAALALLLWPLVRHGRRQGRPGGLFAVVLAVGARLCGHASSDTLTSSTAAAALPSVDCVRPVIAISRMPRRLMTSA